MKATALVVGASSGLGAALLAHLAEEGFRVIGVSRKLELIRQHLSVIFPCNGTHEAHALDVTSHEAIQLLVDDLRARARIPELLVYAAGVNRYGSVSALSHCDWNQAFAVNVRGAFDFCRAIVPHMALGSRIILVCSTAGFSTFEGGTVYCASKAALHSFGTALRAELKARKIAVCLVFPGSMNTPFWTTPREDAQDLLSPVSVARVIVRVACGLDAGQTFELVLRPWTES